MFLHKLELQGFKSFVDRTTVVFGPGINGVVGPNGCGKTNVSDAIRWVLGEQSAKQLRGDSMEDVIFNGCPTRKPLGMAEVHLTLKNDRGLLPTEFSEVTISRRVFRSGMSEYYLNKTPCRLRDIRDLFYDTGMGSHAYSVIERQMVDHVLSDNSGHRRFLFEEASGITKYKARKKEALGKLDATEGDLVRLNDIVFEIERELRSLARQVGKARRYQRLRDRVRELDLTLTAEHVAALRTRAADAAERSQEETVRREGVTGRLNALEAQLNDRKLTLLELERELGTAQSGLRDREETRAQAEQQTVLLGERASGLGQRSAEAAEERARMTERLAEVRSVEEEAAARREVLRGGRDQAQTEAESLDATLAEVERELREQRGAAGEHKQLSLDLFSTEAEKRGQCERIRERRTLLEERRDAGARRRTEIEERIAALGRQAAESETRRVELEAELEEARGLLASAESEVEGAATGLRAFEADMAQRRQEMAVAESRLETLLELKRNYEGVSEGARALLAGDRPAGLVGVLADVLEVPARYLDALESSLGEAAAFLLVEGREGLEAALARLRRVDSGRATLVDFTAPGPVSSTPLPEDPKVVGRASELVRCDERYRPLVDRLLGSVVMTEDRDAAARLATASEGGLRFVSLDGEVWERGRVRGGSARNLSGLLHRETRIRELSGAVAELGLALEAQERERSVLEAARDRAAEARTAALADVDVRREALEGLRRAIEAAAREQAWAGSERDEQARAIEAFEAELATLARAQVEADREFEAFQVELDQARQRIADLDGAARALEARRDEAAARAQQARSQLLQLAREEGECEARWARAEQTRRELESGIEAREAEERQHREAVAGIEAEIAGIAAGLEGLRASEADQRTRVRELQGRFQAAKDEVAADEEQVRALRFEQTELSELLHQIELKRVHVQSDLDRTFERLRTEYDMDPARWTPAPAPEDFDREQAGRELEEARERLRGLGPVNLLAVEEYTKKKERHQFLVQQREDLLRAKAQLLEAIEKINVTASELFVETFNKVQVYFREIFSTLFEGGDAELRTVGEDPLECEIEIAARPRGKHLQSISLMSGGERALTAIALLFAIYLVKPSPFCVLDEVDAPLDDANVERFVRMLQRFSDRTQFVVITHNKVTMESARLLYGVTMQELGVSTLVSARFDRERAPASTPELAEAVS